MAAGKLSPRQKMINLMYLVFIAMLAIQIGPEVLSSFGYMNEKLTAANTTASEKNELTLSKLATKAGEQPEKYAALYEKAMAVNELSVTFDQYLDDLKEIITEDIENKNDYEAMKGTDVGDQYFFEGDGYTANGREFLDRIHNYRDSILQLIGAETPLATVINKRFDTAPQDTEDGKQPWLQNRFEGFPLIATVTNLTALQTDIKTTQSDIFGTLLGGQLESDVSMSNYRTILLPEKSAFFQGERFKGRIVLGRYDASLKPSEVIVNGQPVTDIEDGAAMLDFPAGNVGERTVKGKFVFIEDGKPVEIEINSSYAVIPKPNNAVISADKMNVVYRGVENPMTISIPGVPDNLVKATAKGLRKVKGAGRYLMEPGTGSGKEIQIRVSGTLPDGSKVSSSQAFRIKDIPAPRGTLRKQSGHVKIPKTSIANATVGVELPDFDFDLTLKTTGFTVKVPDQSAVVVRGNKMNAQAKKVINKARRGDLITLFDIKSSLVGNTSYKIKNAAPVSIEVQ